MKGKHMTKQEVLMYEVMSNLAKSDAPLVFKGALVAKLILEENEFNDVSRKTKDIDINWTESTPPMEELLSVVNNSLGELSKTYHVAVVAEYENENPAVFDIMSNETGEPVFSVDINIKPVMGTRQYFIGDATINGVLPMEILTDKIRNVSSEVILFRAKDIVDVYALSQCVKVQTGDIFKMCEEKSKIFKDYKIDSFAVFYNERDRLSRRYKSIRGVINRPHFDVVYNYMKNFIKPFADLVVAGKINKEWDSKGQRWSVVER
jgi:predicted nucleotidyltransferase component of viral defense system